MIVYSQSSRLRPFWVPKVHTTTTPKKTAFLGIWEGVSATLKTSIYILGTSWDEPISHPMAVRVPGLDNQWMDSMDSMFVCCNSIYTYLKIEFLIPFWIQ